MFFRVEKSMIFGAAKEDAKWKIDEWFKDRLFVVSQWGSLEQSRVNVLEIK